MKKLLTKPNYDGRRLLSLLTVLLAFYGSMAWGAVGDTFQNENLNLKFEVLTETEGNKTVSVTGPMWSSPGEIVIPDAVENEGKTYLVTEIKYQAFYSTRFDKVILGANIRQIGEYAFCQCSVSELLLNEGLQEMGENSFYSCRGLKVVNIPSTVNNLGSKAFYACINLKTVTIAEDTQLESILSNVFSGTRIETMTLPEGIKYVSGDAFDDSNLVTLNLPSTFCNMIDGYSFMAKCTGLKAINIASNNPKYKSVDGLVYSKDGDTLLLCPKGKTGTVAIANGTKRVEHAAFYKHTQITQIDIPEGVTDFSVLALYGLERLETINIPSTLTGELGYGAEQPALTAINVAEDNPALCSVDGVLYSKDMTTLLRYPAGRTDTEYVLPDALRKIYNYAFANTKFLETLNTNSSLDSIADYAFYMSYLTQATLNAPLQYIGEKAFCENKYLTTLSLPASLKYIGEKAFDSCLRLSDITFGTYDFSMDDIPFLNTPWFAQIAEAEKGCIYLGTNLIAYINEDQTTPVDIVVKEGTTCIGNFAFSTFSDSKAYNYSHPNIKSITLPASLKRIGSGAFRYLDGITSLTIPDAVEEIDEYALYYMSGLETLHIGKGLKKYGGEYQARLIEGCRRLANVTVDPENALLKAVDNMLVRNNDTIMFIPFPIIDIVVPNGIKVVEYEAFLGYRDDMKERTFTISKDVESVPEGMMFNRYTVAEGNPYYKVADEMLLRCDTLLVAVANQETENLVIPASVKRIGANVMCWNETLKTLKLADGTEVVGEAAFEGCMNLESVDMGKSLTTLEDYAFYNCDNLKELLMPATFRKMYGKSFLGDIKKVTFTAVGEIEYDPSISYNYEEPVTVSYPCVSTVKIVSEDPNFDTNRIDLDPYPGIYGNGEMTRQDTYDETTMTGNELYFTTVDDADDRINYIVVANNTNTTPDTPTDDAPSKAMAKAAVVNVVSAHCANLKIKDGVAFSTPIAFTADVATLERSLDGNWSSIALPFTADVPAGCQVVELNAENEVTENSNYINFTTVTDNMQAGRGYLIKTAEGTADCVSTTNATVEPCVIPEADAQFVGNIESNFVFDDAFRSQIENEGYEFYGFSSSENQFVRLADNAICNTYSAYLKLNNNIDATRLPFVVDQTTVVDQITVDNAQDNKCIYTLEGMKISAPRKGINIIDGKKVMVK